MPVATLSVDSEFLTGRESAALLRYNYVYFMNNYVAWKIPHAVVGGGKILFKRSDLMEWAEQQMRISA